MVERAGRWGLAALGDHLRSGDEEVRLVAQVEGVAIVEIGGVADVDAVFIGPTDLAVSGGFGEGDGGLADLVAAGLRHHPDPYVGVTDSGTPRRVSTASTVRERPARSSVSAALS